MKYSSKFLLVIVSSFITWAGPTLCQAQADNFKNTFKSAAPAIKLTLKPVHDTVQSGSPVEVEVTVTNVSGRVFTYVRQAVADRGGFDYKFDVHDENGSVPPDTKFHRALKGREDPNLLTEETPLNGGLVYLEMQPGQTQTDHVNLNRLYDLKQPGKYVIQAKAFDNGSNKTVKSGMITVTVTK